MYSKLTKDNYTSSSFNSYKTKKTDYEIIKLQESKEDQKKFRHDSKEIRLSNSSFKNTLNLSNSSKVNFSNEGDLKKLQLQIESELMLKLVKIILLINYNNNNNKTNFNNKGKK